MVLFCANAFSLGTYLGSLKSSHIAIRKDAEAVLRLMNSTVRLVVPSWLCSTAALTLRSKVSSSSALILDLSSSVRARRGGRSSFEKMQSGVLRCYREGSSEA